MKKIIYLLGIFILLMLTLNIVLLIKYKEKEKAGQSLIDEYNDLSVKRIMYRQQGVFQQAAEAIPFPDVKLKSPDNNSLNVSSIFMDGRPKLIFRFRDTDCDACIQHSLTLIKEAANQIPGQDIIVLSGYKSVRQFYAYTKTQKMCTYNVNDQSLPLDSQDQPYFFVVVDFPRIQNVFIPIKGDNDYTANYLEAMREKYWHVHKHPNNS